MTAPVAHRSRGDLTVELTGLAAAAGRDSAFHQGAHDALRWLLVGGPGPLTGGRSTLPRPRPALATERAAAAALLSGRPSAGRDYAAGLEHALRWAAADTATAPSATHRGPAD